MIIDTAPVMIWMAGCDNFCNYFNQTWLQFTGRNIQQEQGNGWLFGVHPEDRNHCQNIYLLSSDRQETFQRQYRLLNEDGEYRWILDNAAPRFNEDGEFIGYIGYCVDITEIKCENARLRTTIASLQEAQQTPSYQRLRQGENLSPQHWQILFNTNDDEADRHIPKSVWAESYPQDIELTPLALKPSFINQDYEIDREKSIDLQKVNLHKKQLFSQQLNNTIPIISEQYSILTSIIENIVDAIAIASPEGELLLLNTEGIKLFGFTEESQVVGNKLSHFIFPEDIDFFEREILPIAIAKGSWQGELYLQNLATGKKIPVAYHLFAIANPHTNEPMYLVMVARDITQQKTTEEALYQVDTQYRRLIRTSAERTKAILNILTAKATAELQRQRTEDALRRSEKQFREVASKEALLNCLASQIRASLDINEILVTAVEQIRRLLKIDRCTFIWYRQNSDIPHWEIVYEAKNQDLDSLVGLVNSHQQIASISQQILNQEIIRIDDVNTMPESSEKDLFISWGFKAFLSLPISTQSGEIGAFGCINSQHLRHWQDSEISLLLAAADQIAIAINQAELYKKSRTAARLAQEKAQILESTLQELQATQAQLIQSEKMSSLGQLVAGIAHEINNPINFIHGNLNHTNQVTQDLLNLVEMYQEYYPEPVSEIEVEIEAIDLEFISNDLPKLLNSMKTGTERIRQIVLSLHNFSRLDQADMKAVNIHEGIDSTLLLLQNRFKMSESSAELQIIKEYGNLPLVECYAGQLNQVLMNLLANAIDSLEELISSGKESPEFVPQIKIVTEVKEKCALIHIADNGVGISKEIQQRIFDPFYTTKEVGKGTGMGLSISYKIIVEKHNGQLQCISEPGKGAKFTIAIPLKQI